ncbi:MAG: hypothetical protein FGM58_04010 [Acidimicrobiia bacterium]|nr:hypothetical protein [Acidimicrobiia bacterium]
MTRLVMAGLGVVILLLLLGASAPRASLGADAGDVPASGESVPVLRPIDASAGSADAVPDPSMRTTSSTSPSEGPKIVHVGFYVNDILDIDLERHRYWIDFFVWFRWNDPTIDPSKTFEFMNGAEQWATVRTPATEGPVRLADGSYYMREHVQSMFKRNMPLEDYPFDTLDLGIVMEDVDASVDELVFVPDDPAAVNAPDLTVPGYLVGQPKVTVTDWYYSDLGETGRGTATSSRIELSIALTRPWLPYALKIFVPLLLVVLCAALVFLIGPEHVDARFGLGISSLLTLIALKWTTDGEIPLLDYLGLIDSFYLMAFLFVAIGLADTTYTTWKRSTGTDVATLRRIDRRNFVIAGSIVLAGCALVIVTHFVR